MFQQKAVQDCSFTVDRMEQCRTEFRASLLWLDNISQQLNPEDREQLEKFRKVNHCIILRCFGMTAFYKSFQYPFFQFTY